jgi:hypothetical protein
VNPALTAIVPMTRKAGGTPLMTEVPVEGDLAPFLVTSTKSVIWVARATGGRVRSAIRAVNPNVHFAELLGAVATKSAEEGWGSVFLLSAEGVKQGAAYLREQGFTELTLLVGNDTPDLHPPDNVEVVPTSWVSAGVAALVPTDREYVGVTLDFGNGAISTVLHNASRGVVVLRL